MKKTNRQTVLMTIPSELNHTALIAMAVRGICAMTTLTSIDVNRLELCVVELMNNAIEHAYRAEPNHSVEIHISLDTSAIDITVSDWGIAMDHDQLNNTRQLVLNQNDPAVLLSEGRGLAIVKKLMDKVRYTSKEGKNSFFMRKRIKERTE